MFRLCCRFVIYNWGVQSNGVRLEVGDSWELVLDIYKGSVGRRISESYIEGEGGTLKSLTGWGLYVRILHFQVQESSAWSALTPCTFLCMFGSQRTRQFSTLEAHLLETNT